MSLLHKTSSVLSILSAKDNNSLAFKYPDISIYKTSIDDKNNNDILNPNSNISLTNIQNENENDIISNLNNRYNNNNPSNPENKIYNNRRKHSENNIYINPKISENNIYNNKRIIYTNTDNNIYNDNIKTNAENNNNTKINTEKNHYNNIQTNTDNNIIFNNNKFIPQDYSFQNTNNKEFLKVDNINNNSNTNIKNISPKEIGFSNDLYSKIIIENNSLKEKLIELDSENKTCKSETERQLLIIREENSKLQLEIQRLISKEKASYDQYQNDIQEKIDIINKQKNEIKKLKLKIKEISNENLSFINDIQNLNNKVMNLTNDKQILIDEITELNKSLNDTIKPKLMKNEDYLISLEKQISLLKKDNDTLMENDFQQKSKISIIEKENKLLKKTIESYSSIQTIEDLTINNICRHLQKNSNKNKKYSSCKNIQKEENQKNNTADFERKSIFPNNKMKHCISLKNFKLPLKSRNINYNYNYNYKKIDTTKDKIINNSAGVRKSLQNGRFIGKENENKLFYNTTIKKKNNRQINKNEFYRSKSKIGNSEINNNQLKNHDDIFSNNEKNLYNNNNINNLSESRSLLSSYTEEIITIQN